jgi:hypothetical protein
VNIARISYRRHAQGFGFQIKSAPEWAKKNSPHATWLSKENGESEVTGRGPALNFKLALQLRVRLDWHMGIGPGRT